MILQEMAEPIAQLMKQGTIGSIFLAVLLIALVMFAGWARGLIMSQLKQKDDRIAKLEKDVKELQEFVHEELITLIKETQKLMQKNIDYSDRIEKALNR